ncbi:MAG: OmpH family outer membrane protein [Sphingobacteriales bacterium]
MWSRKLILKAGIILFLFTSAGALLQGCSGKQKTGYVVIEEVFDSFQMKKEMQKKYEKTKAVSDKILDSLQFELQIIAGRLDKEKTPEKQEVMKFEQKREELYKRKQKAEEDMHNLSKEYDKEIIAQLNQYVHDYGDQNGYVYIFGNDKNGTLMYARDAENITKPVLEYINLKYSGKEK